MYLIHDHCQTNFPNILKQERKHLISCILKKHTFLEIFDEENPVRVFFALTIKTKSKRENY